MFGIKKKVEDFCRDFLQENLIREAIVGELNSYLKGTVEKKYKDSIREVTGDYYWPTSRSVDVDAFIQNKMNAYLKDVIQEELFTFKQRLSSDVCKELTKSIFKKYKGTKFEKLLQIEVEQSINRKISNLF